MTAERWARWVKPDRGGEWTLWHRVISYGGKMRAWCLRAAAVPPDAEWYYGFPVHEATCLRCQRKARGRV